MYSFEKTYSIWQSVTFKFPSEEGDKLIPITSQVRFKIPDFGDLDNKKITDFIEDWKDIPGEPVEFNRDTLERYMKNPIFYRAIDEAWLNILRGDFAVKN
jgi:hypothetical protein